LPIAERELHTLKVFPLEMGREQTFINELIDAEYEAMMTLSHENLIKYDDYVEETILTRHRGQPQQSEEKVALFVQEHFPHASLAEFIGIHGPLDDWVCQFHFSQLLGAVRYMHSQGIAHRDLKPENLVLDDQFNLKLNQFQYSLNAQTTSSGSIPVNRHLMPPEFWKMQIGYDPFDADLFACGVILFYMRTGSYPFYDATNQNSYYNRIIRGEYDAFWAAHEKQKKLPKGYFSEEFKNLLNLLFHPAKSTRPCMAEIYCHPWLRSAATPTNRLTIQAHFDEILDVNED